MSYSQHGKHYLSTLQGMLSDTHMLSTTYNKGTDILDNYNWRTIAAAYVVEQRLQGLSVSKSRHGVDATVKGRNIDIEFKTNKQGIGKKLTLKGISAEFDKQERTDMQEKVASIDHLIMASFCEGIAVPIVTLYLPPSAMVDVQVLIKEKQAAFLSKWTGNGRDSIHLNADEITDYVCDTSTIHAYIKGDAIPFDDLALRILEGNIKCDGKV